MVALRFAVRELLRMGLQRVHQRQSYLGFRLCHRGRISVESEILTICRNSFLLESCRHGQENLP